MKQESGPSICEEHCEEVYAMLLVVTAKAGPPAPLRDPLAVYEHVSFEVRGGSTSADELQLALVEPRYIDRLELAQHVRGDTNVKHPDYRTKLSDAHDAHDTIHVRKGQVDAAPEETLNEEHLKNLLD